MQRDTTAMSLEEQLGQLVMVGFYGTTPSPEIIDLIQNEHVGGVILFSRNIQEPQQLRELTQSLQAIAREAGQRYPLLIATDQENGMVRRLGHGATLFPGNMALGAIGSEQVAYDVALATGQELKALGINMNLAPVVDVNNNPANPVIGVRSFGEYPELVARLGAAMVQGYKAAGVISCLKHFPGHGDTAVDSHLALPNIPYGLERLETIELVPFKHCIEAGAESVMIAHLSLPALMKDTTLPSTVSAEIVRDLLREKLGYQGVIISDCLEMKAVADTVGTEQGAVMALQADHDIALISHHYHLQKGAIQAIKAAVQAGKIAQAEVEAAVGRVLRLKEEMLSWDTLPAVEALAKVGSPAHQLLGEQVYNFATTLVRNKAGLVPLRLDAQQRIQVLFLQPTSYTVAVEKFYPDNSFVEAIRQRHPNVSALTIGLLTEDEHDAQLQLEEVTQAINDAALVIVVTVNANLDAGQGKIVEHLRQSGRPVIAIAAYNPYDLLAYPDIETYLATYEYTSPALMAAVRVLFGEVVAQGRLPVSLPGIQEG